MNTAHTLLAVILATVATTVPLSAFGGEVKQLTFGGYNRDTKKCELSELGFMHDPSAKSYAGSIQGEGNAGRAALCHVSIQRSEFDKRYQYCALASIEVGRPAGYVCEVFHFQESVVFSFAHSGPPGELPMCSFVCPSR